MSTWPQLIFAHVGQDKFDQKLSTRWQWNLHLMIHHGEIGWTSAVSRQNREPQCCPPGLAVRDCQSWESLPLTRRYSRSTRTIREGSTPAFTAPGREIYTICRGSSSVC